MKNTSNSHIEHLETLSEIRSLMERSSRFISLSGLSGIVAGTLALIGAAFVYVYLGTTPFESSRYYYIEVPLSTKWGMDYLTFFFVDALVVLVLAIGAAAFFTTRKAKRKKQKIWDKLTYRLLYNLLLPLGVGGVFCLGLLKYGMFGLVAPATLIFYGLALINASKYTFTDIHYLGLCELALGMIALFNVGYGLEFWSIGFGVLHIVYGTLMYFKYDSATAV